MIQVVENYWLDVLPDDNFAAGVCILVKPDTERFRFLELQLAVEEDSEWDIGLRGHT